ncbi:AP-3 complex subunit delta, partial [Asparagus officinalis]
AEENREAVIRSLSDLDPNIRREALHLVMGVVFETNVVEISVLLIGYALRSDPVFANEILGAMLSSCGRNYYEIVQDFDWYVSVLGEMARNPHCEKGVEIERQLVDIGLRVRDARPELVRVARDLLMDPALLGNRFLDKILSAAAWVSGEYVEFSKNPIELLEALLQPRTNLLPPLVRAVYIQAVFKVLVFCLGSYIEKKETNVSFETSDYSAVESEDDFGTSLKLENMKPLTHESLVYLLNLVETAVGPLYECDGVQVQERARNVLGLIRMLKEVPGWETEEGFRKNRRIREIVGFVTGAFSEELGPVLLHAQQKIPVPEGLILKENLADLDIVLGDRDIISTSSTSFSLRSHRQREIEEESEPAIESTALLAEHRKRHGLFYLPTEKEESGSNDYPKANDPILSASNDEPTSDLLKLTEQSLIHRKPKPAKPRPVVVKLDDGDTPSTSLKPVKESKDDKLSGAIRDILLGNKETVPASSRKETSEKSSRRRSKDIPISSETSSLTKENMDEIRHEGSSSRSKHHNKDKHRSHRGKEDNKEKEHKSSSRHGKQKDKHRQREEASLNVVPQAPIIQDFLL